MEKRIVFRADGNSEIGLGHLYRLIGLAEVYRSDFEIVFLTKNSSKVEVIPEIYSISFIPENISSHEEPEYIVNNFSSKSHIIVADGYEFDSGYQRKIKEFGFKLIYIDDLAREHMYADVVINHSPAVCYKDFNKEPYTKLAIGTSYSLLRPCFYDASMKKRYIDQVKNVFVCFGGADPFNLSLKAINALIKLNEFQEINVVLGASYNHQEIHTIAHGNPLLCLHKNLTEVELCNLMMKSDLAIVPSSTILYEICSINIPVLTGFYVNNQELIYDGFVSSGAVYEGGDFTDLNEKEFSNKIVSILEAKDFNAKLNAQHNLFSSEIKGNLLSLIYDLC